MHVKVKLYASLREDREGEQEVEARDGATVSSLIEMLAIPVTQVTLIFINGRHASGDSILSEGDEIALFPPVGGG